MKQPARRVVVLGFVGTTLDQGSGPQRWQRWRPTVALCQQEEFGVDRLELLVITPEPRARNFNGEKLRHQLAADLAQVTPDTQVRFHTLPLATSSSPWHFESMYAALADFAAQYPFDPAHEEYYVHITTGTHVAQICLYLLVERRLMPARLIQTSPPQQGQPLAIIDLDLQQYDQLAARTAAHHAELQAHLRAGVATASPAYAALMAELETVAVRSTDPLLLLGATGTGKTVLAERLYHIKQQHQALRGEFVAVNCATLRGEGAMSALFGHAKGAYTGAAVAREGYLRRAHQGVLFLDEIGELGPDEQAMLLTAIEQQRFYPLGSDTAVHVEFQLIAGTQRNLPAAVRKGEFRDDLWARLATWTFRLPTLRERQQDLPANLDYELAKLGSTRGLDVHMTAEARRGYLAFACAAEAAWPGNFREFGASVRRMATLADKGRITLPLVDAELARLRRAWTESVPDQASPTTHTALTALLGARAHTLDEFDRITLAHVIEVCRRAPTASAAARTLFAVSLKQRTSHNDADRLRKYLARFELTFAMCKSAPT